MTRLDGPPIASLPATNPREPSTDVAAVRESVRDTIGLVLSFRLRSIDALADATALARRLATVDQLTGVLNRHGLLDRAQGLWSTARRLDESG